MKFDKEKLLLYVVTDRSWLHGESLYDQVEKCLKGGATFIQLREKHLDREQFLDEAREIKKLCATFHVPFVINDKVDIALAVDADGVHVGQDDMEVAAAREKLGADKIIGASAHTVKEALLAEKQGADYLGVGAAFATGTKKDAGVIGHETLEQICRAVHIPVVAIGGIDLENVGALSGRGIAGVAVIHAVFAKPDIEAATKALKNKVTEMIGEQR